MTERRARPRHRLLLYVPFIIALHNLEEAYAFPRYLPSLPARLPAALQPFASTIRPEQLLIALAVVTVVPFLIIAWLRRRPASKTATWSALLVAAVVALNAAVHITTAATLFRGYAPGLITALAINLPWCVFLFRRAWRERWVPGWAFALLVPAAIVVHGAFLFGLVALAGTLSPNG